MIVPGAVVSGGKVVPSHFIEVRLKICTPVQRIRIVGLTLSVENGEMPADGTTNLL